MRIFLNFHEAKSELARELKELGTLVHRKSWQGKEAQDREAVRELQNYQYTVLAPHLGQLDPNQPWADEEFKERTQTKHTNPGEAYKLRPDVWEELLETEGWAKGGFSYTYNERFQPEAIRQLVDQLYVDPTTRRAYLTVWHPGDNKLALDHRVPCSLGYFFQADDDRLNMTYFMRSCDWTRHWDDDVYLALKLRDYIIDAYNVAVDVDKGESGGGSEKPYFKAGNFTQFIANFHVFEKDVSHVF